MGGPWTWLSEGEQRRDLDAVAASGAQWIRVSFPWSAMQPQPQRLVWSAHDRIVRLAGQRGLRIVADVAYTPAWARAATCGSTHCPPAAPQAFATFVHAAVRRYAPQGVTVWEIWNEPNIAQYWQPAPDPVAYAALLSAASRAAHSAAPRVTVVSGGLAPRARDTRSGLTPLTFLTRVYDAGAGPALDGVGVHPYTFPAPPLEHTPSNPFTNLPQLHRLMTARGDGHKKLWLTEFGFWTSPLGEKRYEGSVTEKLQAQYLGDAFRAAGRQDWVAGMLWFSLRDSGTGPRADFQRDRNFGLLREDGSAKPAWSVARRHFLAERPTG